MTATLAPAAPQLAAAYTAPGHNAYDAPMFDVFGTANGVKLQHAQTGGIFSCIEISLQPRQMGPPPHLHHVLDEISYVLEGTVTLLVGEEVIEVPKGGYHFRPRGVVHTFWNSHDEPARTLEMFPSSQNFAHYLEELSQLSQDLRTEGANPFAPESIARFRVLDARYQHEVFYEQMPAFLAKYGPKD